MRHVHFATVFTPRTHGIAAVLKRAPKTRPDQLIIANLSGRGDKDVAQAAEFLLEGKKPEENGNELIHFEERPHPAYTNVTKGQNADS